jgi:ribonuclease BN (tRNA processing enzyme)
MIVKILGVGNLFTPEITNTSFLLIPSNCGKKKFLIDCGYNVFQKLVSSKYDIENIGTVIITHTHPDHVGSLGALIYYRWFMFKKTTEIRCGNKVGEYLERYLESTVFKVLEQGQLRLDEYNRCPYNLIYNDRPNSFMSMFEVQHSGIPAYGVFFKKEKIVFTGDTDLLNPASHMFTNANIIFHDCIIDHYARGVHSNIKDMEISYPKIIREKIRLVHHGKKIAQPEVLNNNMVLCREGSSCTIEKEKL